MKTHHPTTAESSTPRPEVIVEFLFEQGLFFIVVRNVGDRPAHKISISFDQKIVGPDTKREIAKLPLFHNLLFLGPQREILMFLDRSTSYFERKQPTKISARVEYQDPEGRNYQARIDHDLEIYRSLPYLQPSYFIGEE